MSRVNDTNSSTQLTQLKKMKRQRQKYVHLIFITDYTTWLSIQLWFEPILERPVVPVFPCFSVTNDSSVCPGLTQNSFHLIKMNKVHPKKLTPNYSLYVPFSEISGLIFKCTYQNLQFKVKKINIHLSTKVLESGRLWILNRFFADFF